MNALLRSVFLQASQSRWLATRLPTWPVARRAVRKFMPGETLAAALDAAEIEGRRGIGAVITHLGENVTVLPEAEAVAQGYRAALEEIVKRKLDGELSIKLTHLGLDVQRGACESLLGELAASATQHNSFLWIDMEGSSTVDATIDIYRAVRERTPRVGVCLQAYLHRTPVDLEVLLGPRTAIRLVKGAYREPAGVAFQDRRDVDARYKVLARQLLEAKRANRIARAVFGTHDVPLIEQIDAFAEGLQLSRDQWEIHMLYGIRTREQHRFAAFGHRMRVLISYGEAWFAWYMRRLAERPANVLFAMRSLVG